MAFIRVTNDDGVTLIDSEVFNLYLAQKGTLSAQWDVEVGWIALITYSAKSDLPPVLAVSCSTHHASLLSVKKINNIYTYIVIFVDASGDNPNFSGNYFIFDAGELTKTGTGLLIIRNKDGYVTFDSDKKYLRVHSIQNYPTYQHDEFGRLPADVVIDTDMNKKLAVVTNKISYCYTSRVNGGELDLTWYYDGIKVSADKISRHVDMYQSLNYISGGANATRNSSDSQYMIVDVTGY
ncbi:hypothetical protein BIY29_05410 [Brenneria alni]|uniref:Uncharacterized protein n=1 Tax=Brenneria alni TaxID=71656 RepID=A0A421DQZ7_9GAMM|nr:hypothetical protein [Brenneria alni]RLM26497.1 hypothetical protein BIY29_05410 [Brenneria alni]